MSKINKGPSKKKSSIAVNGNGKAFLNRLSSGTSMLQRSETLEITSKAKRMKEQGVNIINFSAGEPDFDTPHNVKQAAKKAIDAGYTKYTDASGILELKTAIRQKFQRENSLHYHESNIAVTAGAKYAIFGLLQSIISIGDEVLVPTPYWVSYPSMVGLAGGKMVEVHPSEDYEFRLRLKDIKPVITDKTKAIILNSPNNPTGAVYRLKDLEEIVNYLAERNIFIISDEIYEHLTYGNIQHISAASVVDERYRRNVMVVNGVSKSYAMTGWRIGYAAGPRDVMDRLKFFIGHTTSNPNTPAMYAAVEALSGSQKEVEHMSSRFNRRRVFAHEQISSIPNLSSVCPEAAFYVFVNFNKYLNTNIEGYEVRSTMDLCNVLLEEAHVACVPGEAFGAPGYVRMSYATSLDDIAEGIDNLKKTLENVVPLDE